MVGNPYGKTALSASITLPNFDAYLKKIEEAGNNVDDACEEAVKAALPIVEKSMKAGAERHQKSGDVVKAIEIMPIERDRWGVWGAVGIDIDKHPEAKHGVYQEYGDGHSPGFPDPFVRPAVDDNKKEILATERATLKAKGVPID